MQVKKEPLKVLFYGWVNIPHSYAIVNCFQLIHLYKNYGPNGLKGHLLDIYVEEAPYYNPKWNDNKKLVYSDEYNEILKNLNVYPGQGQGQNMDLVYRQTYPYNINLSADDKDIPKCVFYTSEFAQLHSDYFELRKPDNLQKEQYDQYIGLFLSQFTNIHFTAPSEWSAMGLKRYNINDTRNRIITHGVDSSIFYKHPDSLVRNEIRKMYNIKETDVLMINIGAMTTNKGILLILEALHILVNKLKKVQFKLMLKGSGDLYKCQEFLQSYFTHFKNTGLMSQDDIDNVLKNIIFTNKTLSYSRINDLFNASDLYVSPYLAEGFNLVSLETITTGLNILVPKTGSTQQFIADIYNNGGKDYITYIDSIVTRDPNGMCQNQIKVNDLVKTLLENESRFKTQKSEETYNLMRNYIDKEYSWFKVSELLYDYFNDIVSKSK